MPLTNDGHVNRRQFLAGAAATAAGATVLNAPTAQAATPVKRSGGSYMKLSLAAYSFNRMLPRRQPKAEWDKAEMTLDDFVQYCAGLNLDACEPTGYYFPAEVTQDYLLHIKNMAYRLGLDISGTAIGNDFCLPPGDERDAQIAMCKEWIDHAAVLGAPHIRIFAGKVPNGGNEAEAVDRCIEGINECLDYAATKGVFLGLENHGGITATPEQMLRIIEGVKDSPWFGVNFDSGNFRTDDPYRDLAKIAPYTVNAQIKVMVRPDGGEEVPADLDRIINILKDTGYRGYIVLEYEEDNPKENIPRYIDELRGLIEA